MKTDFETELRKVQQTGNTQSFLIEALKDNQQFVECFFDEFKKAPKKKDVSKYVAEFYTEKQIEEAFYPQKSDTSQKSKTARYTELSNIEKEINQKRREFYSLKETPKEFYTHDITKTDIYREFKAIEAVTLKLRQSMLEPKEKAETIAKITTQLHPDIKGAVLIALIEDNDNIYHSLKVATQSEKEDWNYVKVVFNTKLNDYITNKQPKELTRNIGRPKTEVKDAAFYLQEPKQKAGRKAVVVKDIREYLKFNFDEHKETFISELKKLNYIQDKKEFAHLIMAIDSVGRLKFATNKEWKKSFEKGLEAIYQSQTNFNDRLNSKDRLLISKIEKELNKIIHQNNLI